MRIAETGAPRAIGGDPLSGQALQTNGAAVETGAAAPSADSALDKKEAKTYAVSLLLALAFLCLGAYAVIGALKMTAVAVRFFPNQRENAYTESPHVSVAVEAARTGHFYVPLSQPPYVLQSYGPLFYIVNAAIARLSQLDVDQTRMRIRLFSFACFLCSSIMVFLIVRRLRFSRISALLAALALLAQPIFFPWNIAARPDLSCLLAMLLSLYFALNERWGAWAWLLSGAFAGCAFLIKQPGLAAAVAIVAILAIHKKLRPAAYVALGAAIPVAFVFGVLIARHEPFLEQFTTVGKGLWSLAAGARFAGASLNRVTVLLPITVGAIGLFSAVTEPIEVQMLASFALVSWVVGLSGLPQLGGDVNYFLPGIAGCVLLLPVAMQAVRTRMRSVVGLVLIVFLLCDATYGAVQSAFIDAHLPLNLAADPYSALRPYRILSDAPLLALHGRDPDLLDPFSDHALELAGHWSSAPIVEKVRRGDYDLIVLNCSRPGQPVCAFRDVAFFSPSVVQAINESYEIFCSTMTSTVLTPRSRNVDVAPELLAPALGARCGVGLRGRPPVLFLAPGAR